MEWADFGGKASKGSKAKFAMTKFRQKSNQEQAAASKLRMEKRGEKLEKAKDKRSKQKPPKKPGPIRRVGRAAGGTVHGFVHGKIFEVEQENVGTKGAHRSELVGETVLRRSSRFVKRKIREHPAEAVQRAESKYVKSTADYHFRMAAQEHPEMTRSPVSRMWRRHRMRKQRQKQARRAGKYGAGAVGATTYPLKGQGHPGSGGGLCGVWRRSFKITWTPTKAPSVMTSTILTWTASSAIPMC